MMRLAFTRALSGQAKLMQSEISIDSVVRGQFHSIGQKHLQCTGPVDA